MGMVACGSRPGRLVLAARLAQPVAQGVLMVGGPVAVAGRVATVVAMASAAARDADAPR